MSKKTKGKKGHGGKTDPIHISPFQEMGTYFLGTYIYTCCDSGFEFSWWKTVGFFRHSVYDVNPNPKR